MKKYSNAELQIVRMNNFDIVTASLGIDGTPINNPGQVQTPGRRRSIWE